MRTAIAIVFGSILAGCQASPASYRANSKIERAPGADQYVVTTRIEQLTKSPPLASR